MSSTQVPPSVVSDRRAGRSWLRSRWLLIVDPSLFVCVAAVAAVPFLVPAEQFRPLLMQLLTDVLDRHPRAQQAHVCPGGVSGAPSHAERVAGITGASSTASGRDRRRVP
ncbi:MAG TPA: hypothetical protein VGZ23_15565, partial [bacterium]|nr:hypothetical protein [bacterium]